MEHESELRLLADAIRQARIEKRISQEKLAEMLDVSTTHVRHIESGHRKPSIEKLVSLCQILDLSFDKIVKGEPHPVSTATQRVLNCLENAFSEEERSLIADLIEAAADKKMTK
jgi:transcriptional regulator with XRE-family HTH domain